jgi:hypothetical protein
MKKKVIKKSPKKIEKNKVIIHKLAKNIIEKRIEKKGNSKNYLYFDTTTRNPYRLKYLLKIASPYDGQILTNDLCQIIIRDLIKYQWFEPDSSIKIVERLQPSLKIKEKWNNSDPLSDIDAKILVDAWKPSHGEAGFRGSKKDPHWAARWVTYFRECQVYGLIDFSAPGKDSDLDTFAKPFFITELGKLLIRSIPEGEIAHKYHSGIDNTTVEEQIIFAHIMAKHKSSNPFRRCSFNNSPFPLLLKTLLRMDQISDLKAYLSFNEVLIILVWPNNNHKALVDFIKDFRKKKLGNRSQEEIEKYVMKKLNINSLWANYASGKSAIDAYWRRLKATGLFLRKGYSIYLDTTRKPLMNYIIKNYLLINNFGNEREYFEYMSTIDFDLLNFKQETIFATKNQLKKIAEFLSWEQIKQELKDSSSGNISKIEDLAGLQLALRYEFICAIALTKKFKSTTTNANCRTDSFGWPIGFASGQKGTNTGADIECYEPNMNFIVEPSRGTSKSEQNRECFAIEEHLDILIEQENKEAKSFFIAPSLSPRAKRYAIFLEWEKNKKVMKNLTTDEFISLLENKQNLEDSFFSI